MKNSKNINKQKGISEKQLLASFYVSLKISALPMVALDFV